MTLKGNLDLYAQWEPNTGIMQGWTCNLQNVGDSATLTDIRDQNDYTITKLVDGKCWMTESLKLDISNPNTVISKTNTNKPTDEFLERIAGRPASSSTRGDATGDWCISSVSSCINKVLYNSDSVNSGNGIYYNYYTARAGHSHYDSDVHGGDGDICPAGWRLPTNDEANKLRSVVTQSSLRNYMTNYFKLSGYYGSVTTGMAIRDTDSGQYWTSTNHDFEWIYRLYFTGDSSKYYDNYSMDNRYFMSYDGVPV